MSFGSQVKAWRLAAKLSQTQAARLAGTTQPAWSEWEDEKNTVQRERPTCEKIASALNIPVEEVYSAAGYKTDADPSFAAFYVKHENQVPVSKRRKFRVAAEQQIEALAKAMS